MNIGMMTRLMSKQKLYSFLALWYLIIQEKERVISLVFSGSAFVVIAMMACPLKEPHVAYSLLLFFMPSFAF